MSSKDSLYDSVKAYIPLVEKAYALIKERDAFYIPTPNCKDNDLAYHLLENAIRLSKQQKYFFAFDLYARSLSKVEEGTELMPRILHERSITLDITKYYEESLRDWQRIPATRSVPTFLTSSFKEERQRLNRLTRGMSNQLMKVSPSLVPGEGYRLVPEVSTRILYEKNRFVATSHIPAGACLIAEDATSVAPVGNYSLFCYECMKFCLNPIPCSGCPSSLFCSENCRDQAWREYHRFECKILFALKEIKYRLATKMALSLREIIDADGYPDCYTDIYVDTQYIEALRAADRRPNISADIVDQLTYSAAQVFHVVTKYTNFFDYIKSSLKHEIFKGLLLKLMYIEATLASKVHHKYKLTSEYTLEVSFTAYFRSTSRVRESCAPNASLYFHDTTSEIIAMRNIEPGEEITVHSELYHHVITEKEERQRIFRNKYSSSCRCEACENNWPLIPDIIEKYISNNSDFLKYIEDLYFRIVTYSSDPDITTKCFDQVIMLSARTKWSRPSIEWFTFETIFLDAHASRWLSEHTLIDFVRNFPNSV